MSRALLPLLSAALLLTGCANKVVTIPGPEVVRLVPAKVDPRLLQCMDVTPPTPDAIPEGTSDPMVAAILGTWAQRYQMAWKDCRAKLKAIEETQ
ncbi:MAG TPA: hypothetical protein VFS41_04540 [Edaphobacter sp.]|nr:hypothetical protein [Edaphobacter sp.]